MSSATLGAVAKFARRASDNKKDLAMQAWLWPVSWPGAMGADPQQTLKAFREAEAYEASLIMPQPRISRHRQRAWAVQGGLRSLAAGQFNPVLRGATTFLLDSPRRGSAERLPQNEFASKCFGETPMSASAARPGRHVLRRFWEYEMMAGRPPRCSAPMPGRTSDVKFDPEALRAARVIGEDRDRQQRNRPAGNGSQVIGPSGTSAALDLRTRYMGLWLRNPVVASAGPLSQTVDGIKSLAAGGVGAVVMYSLFEEQIRHEAARETALAEQGTESFAEALSYFPTAPSNDSGLTRTYLELIEKAAPVIDVPLIASLNGSTTGEWTQNARRMQDAGAAAIELNVYYVPGDITTAAVVSALPGFPTVKSRWRPGCDEAEPYLSSFGKMARPWTRRADGLVLFTATCNPTSAWTRWRSCPARSDAGRGEAACSAGSVYGRVNASLANHRRRDRGGRGQAPVGRRRRGDDHGRLVRHGSAPVSWWTACSPGSADDATGSQPGARLRRPVESCRSTPARATSRLERAKKIYAR